MELTFLVDNNSFIGTQFLAEPALSIYIREGGKNILFDAGYSNAFMVNALHKGIDLLHLDWLALSHGHLDHTWGLDHLIRHYYEAAVNKLDHTRPQLVAHPQAFISKRQKNLPEIGMLLAEEKLSHQFELVLTDKPLWLTDKLVTLGEIERVMDFEPPTPLGERLEHDGPVPDDMPDDTALACVTDSGLVVISGCSHVGICNIVEQAKRVTGVDKVRSILGGFHLQNAQPERLDPTVEYLASLDLDDLYACHCTDLAAKIAMAQKCPLREVGSGLTLKF
ncbi:MBL fold metallo-hydrolase [Pseudodesulfovibrio sp. JC047]|uniref:MBL fold metallo-hydrolase n=1 Tax=Pseudodesulfovibrio sp. JC047 TaxID=2683199 RepID=UPI0013D1F741|nr:MBL fold metallo-hydrolase [Pseudodesulfovibrio sp. JC047]NDV18222.1 MBL fold metallo-hydrolase [Pseudodesulfovibrio sp. JC047]